VAVRDGLAIFGEVGLAGEVRAVDMARQRVSEAAKFGFLASILPASCLEDAAIKGMQTLGVSKLLQSLELALED
jgi:DNA repair protein RadA/Sms